MKENLLTALLAFIAQISGLIAIVSVFGIFLGSADAKIVFLVAISIFISVCIFMHKRKGGWAWLATWSIPFPF